MARGLVWIGGAALIIIQLGQFLGYFPERINLQTSAQLPTIF
jgi:hypothetical protein